jgi:hypothetical protein
VSTAVLRGLAAKIHEFEKTLKRSDLSEWEIRWTEYKLVEAKFWYWTEIRGFEERLAQRENS